MSNYSGLKSDINNNIYENQTQQITGTVLNAILNEMTASLGAGYQFAGVATVGMNPGDPDQRVFYLAGEGVYTMFGGLQVPAGKLGVLKWDYHWTLETIDGLGGGGANLTGYVTYASTDDLPDVGEPTLGYLCGTNLYLYVGTGGDTKGGKYQNCGSFRGPQGLKGDPGVGISTIAQTTTSTEDEGINVITVTKEDGTQSTFQVRNGSKGSQGIQGPQGVQGEPGRLQAQYKEVETLPTASADTVDYIYLVASQTPNTYDMYYTEENQGAYSWKSLGTTAVQLSDYATKAEVNQLEAKVDNLGNVDVEVTDFPFVGILNNDGTLAPPITDYSTSDYISTDKVIKIKGNAFPGIYNFRTICLYDEDKAFVASLSGSVDVAMSDYPTAKYLRCSKNNETEDYYTELTYKQCDLDIMNLDGRLDIVEETVSGITETDAVNSYPNGGILNYETGAINTAFAASWETSDFIPLEGVINISGVGFPAASSGTQKFTTICLYAENKTTVVGGPFLDTININISDYPTAKYLRCSREKNSATYYTNIKKYTFSSAEDIENLDARVTALEEEIQDITLPNIDTSDFILPHCVDGEGEYTFIGRWFVNNGKKTANADGSSILFRVSGVSSIDVNFTTLTTPTNTPYFAYSIDGSSFTRQLISSPTVTLPDNGEHIIWIVVDGQGEIDPTTANKWNGTIGMRFEGVTGGTKTALVPLNKQILFIGDSIVEGINTLGTGANANTNSATAGFAWKTARKLNAVPLLGGFGATRIEKGTYDSTPQGSFKGSLWAIQYNYYGERINAMSPDVVFIEYGQNDIYGESGVKGDYDLLIDRLNIQYPGVPIVCMIPFSQKYANVMRACAQERSYCYLIETNEESFETSDGTHLSANGATQAAEYLKEKMLGIFGKGFFLD